jgi:hypothetical protein
MGRAVMQHADGREKGYKTVVEKYEKKRLLRRGRDGGKIVMKRI